ncbi:peroxiredoxin family protein [Tuwongella immobilis]|uniref:Thioredoxin domain-containing protein n=1 Tax=Tuwongella immobilis TaxID=692036 RepID=A0A6C2YL65_9BACT|nr:TlpA disulfide reductase family protein [Tuwongella immobilis]VIP02320.1 Thiol:disulfide interchange protein OS=Singulisphaera acidiphila (strain ATCC BAA-1392 / DSM 18658 / VKM B-2454 / MOB10) GN=Sinac_3156 PE=4 SV=1: Thioredoxin_8 [Tuwongella immobilis]VTS01046.1 Thiol:disulfide interchange protein OS=Singulisphaera acidiphila (strain ATCC BAA-1392 / DSM 18658 / VKM B-2454 / MOB10) GN=Sinac_3156 PE=4 SV=1: Thioredoxin_8 [Tuwongella immobilis]
MTRFDRIGLWMLIGVTTAIIGGHLAHTAAPEPGDTGLRILKYPQLVDALRSCRGQVVLVDCWMDTCIPCKKGFPRVVAMHQKYAAAGLQLMTLCLSDASDLATQQRVRGFLSQQRVPGMNILLDEPATACQTKLNVQSVPCLFLFDRDGRLLQKWCNDTVQYDQIEQRVIAALRS